MINARRHNHQVMLLQLNPHPIITLTSHIKKAPTIKNIPDLLILVQVLVEEILHFFFVHVAHGLWGNGNFIAVLVIAFRGNGVHVIQIWEVESLDAELSEVIRIDCAARVVGLALVAL
jgi:hypothetical protein